MLRFLLILGWIKIGVVFEKIIVFIIDLCMFLGMIILFLGLYVVMIIVIIVLFVFWIEKKVWLVLNVFVVKFCVCLIMFFGWWRLLRGLILIKLMDKVLLLINEWNLGFILFFFLCLGIWNCVGFFLVWLINLVNNGVENWEDNFVIYFFYYKLLVFLSKV